MSAAGPDPRPTVTRTRLLSVLLAAAVGGLVAAVVALLTQRFLGAAPSPGPAAVWIALITLLTVISAVLARRRIQRDREAVDPTVSTSWLALAKTALTVGGALAGAFLTYALAGLGHIDTPAGKPRFWLSIAAAAAALAWVLAGWWLERNCLIPPDEGDDVGPGEV